VQVVEQVLQVELQVMVAMAVRMELEVQVEQWEQFLLLEQVALCLPEDLSVR
jgi:hypothetical protein